MSVKTRLGSYAAAHQAGSVPTNTTLPLISGTAEETLTLNGTSGTWLGSPTSYSYQWRRCDSGGGSCTNITSATSSSYVVQTADIASTLRLRVTATNGVGTSSAADSAQTAVVTAAPGPVANNIVALLGDSRVYRVDGDAVPAGGFMHHAGFALWARRFSGGAVQFNRGHNFAVGGYSTTDVINNTLATCAASDAASVLLMVGVNDFGKGIPQATSLGNIDTIVSTLTGAGQTVFICDDSPAVESSSAFPQHVAIRDHIRAMAGTSDQIYVIPSWNAVAVTPDSTTPGPGMEDTVHYGPGPASRVGQQAATVMLPLLPTFDLFGRGGVLQGGDFTGTGGSLVGGATGTVPNGWTVALEAGTGTVAASIVASGGLNWLVLTVSGTNSGPAVSQNFRVAAYTGNLSSGWLAGTDVLDLAIKCKVDSGSQNVTMCQMTSVDQTGLRLPLSNGNGAYDGAIINSTTNTLFTDALDMTLWMPFVAFPGSATSFNQRIEIRGLAGVTASGTFRFALPQLRKYTGTLSDSQAPQLIQKAVPATGVNISSLTSGALASTPVTGDLLSVAVATRSNSNVTVSTPSGWTAGATALNSTHVRVATFYKIAGASEPTSVSFTFSGSAGAAVICGPYEWLNYAGGIESAVTNTVTGVDANLSITASAATTDGDELCVAFHGHQGNQLATGTTTGWTIADSAAADGGDGNTRVGGHFAYKGLTANETPSNFIQVAATPQYAATISAFKVT